MDSDQVVVSDKEKVLSLFKELGVPLKEVGEENAWMIEVDKQDEKVVGYSGFVCEFVFNTDGSFKHVGVWE